LIETLAARGVTARGVCIEPRLPSRHVSHAGMHYVIGDGRRLPLRRGAVDLVHFSLVLHHLPDNEVESVLGEAAAAATGGVLVNDLVRSYAAWLGVKALTGILGDSVARVDGPLSIRRAFRPAEIEERAKRAGLRGVKFRRHLFFRFTLSSPGFDTMTPKD
jgi:ubiquinone/menaquinone biosynthesis C-methylase UbiE